MSDFLGGLMSRRMALLAVLTISQTAGLIVITLVVAARGEPAPSAEFVPYAAAAGLGGICGLAAFYRALAVGKMGVVAPISSMAVVVPVVVGLASGERPSSLQFAGALMGIVGIALASREAGDEAGAGTRAATGAGLALLSAVGIGLFFVFMDAAAEDDALWAALVNRASSLSLGWLAVLAFRPSFRGVGRRDVPVLVGIGVLEMAANVSFAFASTEGLLSVTSVLSSLYPLVTMVLAWLILRERLERVQRIGGAAALVGVSLIASG